MVHKVGASGSMFVFGREWKKGGDFKHGSIEMSWRMRQGAKNKIEDFIIKIKENSMYILNSIRPIKNNQYCFKSLSILFQSLSVLFQNLSVLFQNLLILFQKLNLF